LRYAVLHVTRYIAKDYDEFKNYSHPQQRSFMNPPNYLEASYKTLTVDMKTKRTDGMIQFLSSEFPIDQKIDRANNNLISQPKKFE
jgi:hypothetical protein